METKNESALRKHILATYLSLRYGVAVIGALLPIAVWILGIVKDVELQDSISAYYWAVPQDECVPACDSVFDCEAAPGCERVTECGSSEGSQCRPKGPAAPSRDWFVGSLFIVAALLYLYKGFSKAENYLLNLTGILLLGVAIFPTEQGITNEGKFSVHGFCAVSAFVCMAIVMWFFAKKTVPLLPAGSRPGPGFFKQAYHLLAMLMVASPATAFISISVLNLKSAFIFFAETVGIWTFAAYWLLKSIELGKSAAVELALEGKVAQTSSHDIVYDPIGPRP